MTDNIKPTNLPYDDFAKLDIRTGTIIHAELVPKSKKLLKLQVDFGEQIGTRTIVAGIAFSYSPEVAVGERVVAILNLASRIMMGIQSDGMLLATRSEDGMIGLISPVSMVANGLEVG